jgi:hypothetical protein
MAITGRGMDFTGRVASTADTLTGAGTIIAGTRSVATALPGAYTPRRKAGEPPSRRSESGATENFHAPATVLCAFDQCGSNSNGGASTSPVYA